MNSIYKDAIANEFVALCGKKRMKEITVGELIKACGISRQTFYNHFSDKYDVMSYVFDNAAKQATIALNEGNGYLQDAIEEMLLVFRNSKEYYTSVARMDGQNGFLEFFIDYTTEYYTYIVTQLLGPDAITKEIAYQIEFNAYGVSRMVINYILSGMEEDPKVVAQYMVDCIPNSLQEIFSSVHVLRKANEQATEEK